VEPFSNRFSGILGSFEISLHNTEDNATHGTLVKDPTDNLRDSISNNFSLDKNFCQTRLFGLHIWLHS